MVEQLKNWDRELFVYLNSLGIEDYDAFWIFVTQIKHWIPNFTKAAVARLRPNNVTDLADVIRILQTPDNYSFFSGHASSSFVVTTFLVLTLREKYKWIYIMYLWPILFIMSRIYVGVHYPGDILVGAFVGTVIAFLFYKSYQQFLIRYFGE